VPLKTALKRLPTKRLRGLEIGRIDAPRIAAHLTYSVKKVINFALREWRGEFAPPSPTGDLTS